MDQPVRTASQRSAMQCSAVWLLFYLLRCRPPDPPDAELGNMAARGQGDRHQGRRSRERGRIRVAAVRRGMCVCLRVPIQLSQCSSEFVSSSPSFVGWLVLPPWLHLTRAE